MVTFVTSTLEVKENSDKKQVNSKLKSYVPALIQYFFWGFSQLREPRADLVE